MIFWDDTIIDNYELPALILWTVQEEMNYPEDGGSKPLSNHNKITHQHETYHRRL
jgi:hypothetical protein